MTTGTNRPEMRDVAAALADILDLVPPVASEMVPVAEAAGRVLAEKVTARVSHPGLTVSAMDGYGVRSEDASTGANLRVTGTIYAGPYQTQQIGPGEAVRLFTGSPLPLGADAVALQENVEPGEGTITLRQAVPAGDYVRPEGFDFRTGEVLLDAPRRLSPEDLALAAASNRDGLRVACRPHVLVLATGAELVLPGTTQGPGQVVASTGFGMAALIERQGGTAILVPPVNDDPAHIRAGIEENPSDIIVTLGGASVGDRDFIARDLARNGVDLAFHGVAMRPGKPTLAGRMGGRLFLGLPGNPVSALVCAQVFLRPVLDACLGLPAGPRPRQMASLGCDLSANGPREHYMRARLETAGGRRVCTPFGMQDSSMLRNLAHADVLAVLPPHAPACHAGDAIECIDL